MTTYVMWATNLKYEKFEAIRKYKQTQADTNQEAILTALNELGRFSSSKEIESYLRQSALKKAKSEATQEYEKGNITTAERNVYIKENSRAMDLRTVQRWLRRLVEWGLVIKKENKYALANFGKREIQFMNFAKGYGNTALNALMDCYFPTLRTREENLYNVVEIFGFYVVYCFLEAARLISANREGKENHWKSSFFGAPINFDKEGKFRERNLINGWIKEVFDPWHMFNLFLTTISNCSTDKELSRSALRKGYEEDEDLLNRHTNHYEPIDISQISKGLLLPERPNTQMKGSHKALPPTALDLMIGNIISNIFQNSDDLSLFKSLRDKDRDYYHFAKRKTTYKEDELLSQMDEQEIKLLKDLLKNKFPFLFARLSKTDQIFYG